MSDGVSEGTQHERWGVARKRPVKVEYQGPFHDIATIETIEGDFEVDEEYLADHGGYYLIRGVEGEVYPCSIRIFEETYEVVDGPGDDYHD